MAFGSFRLPNLSCLVGLGNRLTTSFVNNSDRILPIVGVGLMGVAVVQGIQATPDALVRIEQAKLDLDKRELTKVETVKAAWKSYVKCLVTAILGGGCVFFGMHVSYKKQAVLAATATVLQNELADYTKKTIEKFGEDADREIRQEIAEERAERDKDKIDTTNMNIFVSKNLYPCYDSYSQQYHWSNIDILRTAISEVNVTKNLELSAPVNDFYDHAHFQNPPRYSDSLVFKDIQGRNYNIEIKSKGGVTSGWEEVPDGTPCLIYWFSDEPNYDTGDLHIW